MKHHCLPPPCLQGLVVRIFECVWHWACASSSVVLELGTRREISYGLCAPKQSGGKHEPTCNFALLRDDIRSTYLYLRASKTQHTFERKNLDHINLKIPFTFATGLVAVTTFYFLVFIAHSGHFRPKNHRALNKLDIFVTKTRFPPKQNSQLYLSYCHFVMVFRRLWVWYLHEWGQKFPWNTPMEHLLNLFKFFREAFEAQV